MKQSGVIQLWISFIKIITKVFLTSIEEDNLCYFNVNLMQLEFKLSCQKFIFNFPFSYNFYFILSDFPYSVFERNFKF